MIPFRDENPSSTTPYVTHALLAANIGVFLLQFLMGGEANNAFIFNMGLIPLELIHGQNLAESPLIPPYASVFTSMFLHGGFLHLGGNMLYLHIFGDNVEDALGHVKFLIFYLGAGLIAAASQVLINPASAVPMIGASGAVAGILGAYIVLYPRARVDTLVFLFIFVSVIPLPAVVVLGFWFVIQLFSGLGSVGAGAGVAWFAHIGGFIVGALLVRYLLKKGWIKRPKRKTGYYKVVYR